MSVSVQYLIRGETASAIAGSIEEGARTGGIAAGAPLPTVRALAKGLAVSPATVASAYRLLKARGLLASDGRRGTRLSDRPPLATLPPPPVPAHLRNLADGNPDPALLPRWKRALRSLDDRPLLYGEPTHRPGLLQLAQTDLEADGIPAGNLVVVGGALDGIERVLQAHVRAGDRVAVEDPGYTAVFDLLAALGLVPEPVPLDDRGMRPVELQRALRAGTAACILTPRAQNPTGAAFDATRARELRAVLDGHPRMLVIEDDHAGPVAGVPLFTVVNRRRERWAVVRSVSKSLGPDLRLAILAGDALTVARVEGRRALGTGWVSKVLQALVETLWADPRTARTLQAAAATYARRRQHLVEALAGFGIAARGRSGLNVWIQVPEETAVLGHLAAAGWAVRAGERYRLRTPPAIRVTASTLGLADADRFASDLFRALSGVGRRETA